MNVGSLQSSSYSSPVSMYRQTVEIDTVAIYGPTAVGGDLILSSSCAREPFSDTNNRLVFHLRDGQYSASHSQVMIQDSGMVDISLLIISSCFYIRLFERTHH